MKPIHNRLIILALILFIAVFKVPAHWAIIAGLFLALVAPPGTQDGGTIKKASSQVLQWSIVLLGPSLNYLVLVEHGLSGFVTTFISIALTLLLGMILARLFKIPSPFSSLISSGTAICGGSAIGAVGPILKADQFSMAVSLSIIFILNAISVFLLPSLGQLAGLSQEQFGVWAALAIHDTSAVVAASNLYGESALQTATTLKLIRALWIIPLSLFFVLIKKEKGKITFPWFILFFVAASALFSLTPSLQFLIAPLKTIAKIGFSLALFLIGLSLKKDQLKKIEFKFLNYALGLWLIVLLSSFFYVKTWIP